MSFFRLQIIVWLVSKISETVLDKMQIQPYLGPNHTERQQGVCDTATDIASNLLPIDFFINLASCSKDWLQS